MFFFNYVSSTFYSNAFNTALWLIYAMPRPGSMKWQISSSSDIFWKEIKALVNVCKDGVIELQPGPQKSCLAFWIKRVKKISLYQSFP